MARRLSTGIAGRNVLGSIVAVNNSLRSVVDNANVILEPNGNGIAVSTTDFQINSGNSLRLADSDSSNFIALRSPGTVASNVTLTFPATAGSNTQVLTTNGSGILSWTNAALTITNRSAADNNTYYVAMADSTTGTEDTLSIASDRLTFVPNPGRLSAAEMRVTASTASSSSSTGAMVITGGLGIGGATFCNAITATSITETSSIVLKENISPIANALDTILNLEGVNYTRKSNGKYEAGLIAEEVEKIAPELVDSSGEYKSIHYGRLSAYLIEAVKYLKHELDKVSK